MGTRSLLIAAAPGPEARTIYCHRDSQIYELGRTLSRHYGVPAKVKSLFRHGDAISIMTTPKQSEFFHRDRGSPMNRVFHPTVREALEAVSPAAQWDIEYVYLFAKNEWAVMRLTEHSLAEPAPVTPETMTDDIAERVEPEYHDLLIEKVAEGDQALAKRLRARAQAFLAQAENRPQP